MSKQRRGRGSDKAPESPSVDSPARQAPDADIAASEAIGNAAFQAGMGQEHGWAGGDLLAELAGSELGGVMGAQVAAGLRAVPRLAEQHARFLAILEGSDLERRAELMERLEAHQTAALGVQDAVREHLGDLSETERTAWADAYAAAQGDSHAAVAEEVHVAQGGRSPGVTVLAQLTATILARAALLEEEEEEPLGMDYATEESGM